MIINDYGGGGHIMIWQALLQQKRHQHLGGSKSAKKIVGEIVMKPFWEALASGGYVLGGGKAQHLELQPMCVDSDETSTAGVLFPQIHLGKLYNS